MAFTVTSAGRRLAMSALLLLAIAGALIRHFAPDPSTLRDVGTLLLVLWLPAIGNLIAYLVGKIPRRRQRAAGFGADSVFVPHLRVSLESTGLLPDLASALAAARNGCTLVQGQAGYTARVGEAMPLEREQLVALELLRPSAALPALTVGSEFHLLVGATAAAKGRVVEVMQVG